MTYRKKLPHALRPIYSAVVINAANFTVTPGAFQTVSPGGSNGFVTKINPAGDALLYSTFLGGSRDDEIKGIAIDAAGNAYVGGYTDFSNFPTTAGALMTIGNGVLGGGPFVTKLNSTGSALIYSTYLSGGNIRALVVNASAEVYVTGTAEANLTTTNDAFQQTPGGSSDAFVARLNASGSGLLYSTYLGGSGQDHGTCIAIDNTGAVYIAGLTFSTNFPLTQDAFQTTPSGNQFDIGSFVAKIGEATTAQTYRIRGRLADNNGNGIARARVLLEGSPGGTQFTDANGNYSFGSLTPGNSYSVTPSSPFYDFNPPSRSFNNLSADQTADFNATVRRFGISGLVKDINGAPLQGVTMTLSGAQSATTQTDVNGSYTFSDLSGHQTANFTATYRYGSISGHVTDSDGRAIYNVLVTLSGAQNLTTRTDANGNYSFFRLLKGNNYTISASEFGYTLSPAPINLTITEDHTLNFTATLKKLKPFAPGNILVTSGIIFSGKYLAEYTPGGTLVQDVIVPFRQQITATSPII